MASRSLRRLQLSGSRFIKSSSRTYATAVQTADFKVSSSSSGIKIATLDEGLPTSAIPLAVKAGPRYDAAPGLAHVLKNFVFKSTNKRSTLRLTRETELLGGVLSSSLSREHLFLTAECLRGDEPYFAEILGDVLVQSKYSAHEFHEDVVPSVAGEYEAASRDAATLAVDFAHQLAFRRGLGNSLFASPHLEVDLPSAVAYARSSLANPSNIAVLSSGSLDQKRLNDLVGEFYTEATASASSSSPAAASGSAGGKTSYFGGEMRVPMTGHGGHETGYLLVGFQGGAQDSAEHAVLKTLLGGQASTKWGKGSAPFSQLTLPGLSSFNTPTIQAFNLAYSDAGLFGFTIKAPTDAVKDIATKAVAALKQVAEGVKEEDVKRAVAKAKFDAASLLESRSARQELIGAQILENSKVNSLADAFALLDKVDAKKVQEAAKAALKSKATVVAIGNTHKLPYADELGL